MHCVSLEWAGGSKRVQPLPLGLHGLRIQQSVQRFKILVLESPFSSMSCVSSHFPSQYGIPTIPTVPTTKHILPVFINLSIPTMRLILSLLLAIFFASSTFAARSHCLMYSMDNCSPEACSLAGGVCRRDKRNLCTARRTNDRGRNAFGAHEVVS